MRQSLELKLGQKLAMTPQLQHAIKLLQLSVIDLRTEIQSALESNPLLDTLDADEGNEESPETPASDNNVTETSSENQDTDEAFEQGPANEDLKDDYDWEDDVYIPVSSSSGSSDDNWTGNEIDTRNSAPATLHDHLTWQLQMTALSERDRIIASTLIEAVNNDGYLSQTIDEILQSLNSSMEVEEDEVIAVLHMVQSFDPIGVAARDIADSLLIQLRQYAEDTPHLETARKIVSEHLDLIGSRDMARLKRAVRATPNELNGAITLIQGLNPRPGSSIQTEDPRYIIPDLMVKKINGRWRINLNEDALPKLGVNKYYQSLIKRGDRSDDNRYLKNNLQEARWYIKSLQNRHDTLLRVASEILKRQYDFFEHGDTAMKPMVLHNIAEALDLHESTISRVTTHKYMQTPLGVFELKYFFSSHVSTTDGGTCSATAIRSHIRTLIEDEPPSKPISDNRIAELLSEQGIQVARRTVAKYRELMTIPPSNMRKSLTT
jgi:RNA polymerase sigma-54 factor